MSKTENVLKLVRAKKMGEESWSRMFHSGMFVNCKFKININKKE
jgi:hypothetical protein